MKPLGRGLAEFQAQARNVGRYLRQWLEDQRGRHGGRKSKPQWRNFPAPELARRRSHRLSGGEGALEHRQHLLPQVGQLREVAFPQQQWASQFVLQLLDRLGQRRLGHVALLRRAGEVEGLRDRQEVSDLVQLHRILATWIVVSCCSILGRRTGQTSVSRLALGVTRTYEMLAAGSGTFRCIPSARPGAEVRHASGAAPTETAASLSVRPQLAQCRFQFDDGAFYLAALAAQQIELLDDLVAT